MHVASSYPLYCSEALQRMYTYRPPYGGGYATPWLWYDGNHHGSYTYSTWQSKIVARMAIPSPVTVTMWGDYSQTDGSGTISAQFRNDGSTTLSGRVLYVITEDSLYYAGPNGDVWHNHVARDYIPNQNGQLVSIPAGDSLTVTYAFTILAGWDENKCDIITMIQDTQFQADSTKEVWQGGIKHVMELVGIEEHESNVAPLYSVTSSPNPCVRNTAFQFELPVSTAYRINIFDVSGRHVKSLSGIAQHAQESVTWNLTNEQGVRLSAGVYLFKFESDILNSSGKIIIR